MVTAGWAGDPHVPGHWGEDFQPSAAAASVDRKSHGAGVAPAAPCQMKPEDTIYFGLAPPRVWPQVVPRWGCCGEQPSFALEAVELLPSSCSQQGCIPLWLA